MDKVYQFILCVAGLFLLFLAYRMYRKEWQTPTWVFALLGIISILGAQGWLQGFLKTQVVSMGLSYGEKLNTFQSTVTQIEQTVRDHQTRLDQHQQDISRQQAEISDTHAQVLKAQVDIGKQQEKINSQSVELISQGKKIEEQQQDVSAQQTKVASAATELAAVVSQIDEQQKRIANVEALIENIYSHTRTESMYGTDSNRVFYAARGSNALWGIFLLNEVPVRNSLQGYFDNNSIKPPINTIENLACVIFVGNTNDWKGKQFNFSYVSDVRQTNRLKQVEVRDGALFADGIHIPLPRE